MAGKRTDGAIVDARVAEVAELIIASLTTAQIHRYIVKERPEWRVQKRQRDKYIAGARARIAASADVDIAEETGKAIGQLRMLFNRCLAINDYKACAAIVKQITDLLGLAKPTRFEHSGAIEVTDARKRIEDEIAAVLDEAERAKQG